MTDDIGDWNYEETTSEVWFDELKIGKEYCFCLNASWYEDLNGEYRKKQREITIECSVYGLWTLEHNRKIPDGERIIFKLWRGFFDKWKKADKCKLEKNKGITITIKKTGEKKWGVINLEKTKMGVSNEI